jgi:hypothetical protein
MANMSLTAVAISIDACELVNSKLPLIHLRRQGLLLEVAPRGVVAGDRILPC